MRGGPAGGHPGKTFERTSKTGRKPLSAGTRLIQKIYQDQGKLIPKGTPATMSTPNPDHPIHELRVALTTRDYERLVKFYCEGLGIKPAAIWNNGQGQALVLNMGNATLEIFDEAQAETIDQIEAGQRVSGQIRFALQVPDLKAAMERLLAHGAIPGSSTHYDLMGRS